MTRQPNPTLLAEIPNHFSDEEMDFETFPNVVSFEIKNRPGHTLSCAMVEPAENPAQEHGLRIPLVLIIPGQFSREGFNNKNENLFSPSLGRWAQWLAAAGIRSVVVNPMGQGRSEGDYGDESIANLIDTWQKVFLHVRSVANTDSNRVRLLTNSMGGHIGLRLAQSLPFFAAQVDRLVLQSPFFYSEVAEQTRFGHRPHHLAIKLQRDIAKSPAFKSLQNYEGSLFLSHCRQEDVLGQNMVDYANAQLAIAIEQERGLGIGYPYVKHNNRPLDESPAPHIMGQTGLKQRTINQAAENVVDFLAAA